MKETLIWTEKYRPQTFAEIKGQTEIVEKVSAFVKQKNMPHLLFAGPAGCGKSTLALVIAKELFGKEWKQNFLELNASDTRGIETIRGQVKDFARTRSISQVPFKIIFLDEADALTREAQQALRRTMENFTRTTRFILSCNFSSKIIDPLQSRCAVFRFKPLSKKEIFEKIEQIAREEGLTLEKGAPESLFKICEGDCRKLENILQSCAVINKQINKDLVYSMAAIAKPKEVKEVLILALKNKFLESREKLFNLMLDYGLSGLDLIKQIQKEIWDLDKNLLSEKQKMALIEKCGETEFRITEGSDSFLQLESFLAFVGLVGFKEK